MKTYFRSSKPTVNRSMVSTGSPRIRAVADTLDFKSGPLKMRGIVRYIDYKKFQTSVKLKFGGEVTDDKAEPATDPEKEKLAPALDPKFKTEPAKTEKK